MSDFLMFVVALALILILVALYEINRTLWKIYASQQWQTHATMFKARQGEGLGVPCPHSAEIDS